MKKLLTASLFLYCSSHNEDLKLVWNRPETRAIIKIKEIWNFTGISHRTESTLIFTSCMDVLYKQCSHVCLHAIISISSACDLAIGQRRHNCTADESATVQFIVAYMYLLIVFHLNPGNLNQNDSKGLEFPESWSKFPSASLGCLFPSILLLVLHAACRFGFTQSLRDSLIMKCQLSIKPALLTL